MIDIAERDMDVPLSELGERQARALGHWFGERPKRDRPTIVMASPYKRAARTAELALEAAGMDDIGVCLDERLREREFGQLDRLTRSGIESRFPDEAAARKRLGKFYHRPVSGESWADVALRVRSALDTIGREYGGERVLLVSHQVVILLFRYVFDGLTEQELLAVDREQELANCGVTEYRFDPKTGRTGGMRLHRYNDVEPVAEAGQPVTAEPDVASAAR
ncbi:MAG: 2,3-bisphosphoglycerate-dependent phosphoglycerate mutase [Acidimicrobiaceae bacterium]